jgi:hypothetical protein
VSHSILTKHTSRPTPFALFSLRQRLFGITRNWLFDNLFQPLPLFKRHVHAINVTSQMNIHGCCRHCAKPLSPSDLTSLRRPAASASSLIRGDSLKANEHILSVLPHWYRVEFHRRPGLLPRARDTFEERGQFSSQRWCMMGLSRSLTDIVLSRKVGRSCRQDDRCILCSDCKIHLQTTMSTDEIFSSPKGSQSNE